MRLCRHKVHLGWDQNFGVEAQNNAGDNESEKMMAQLMRMLGKDVNNVSYFTGKKSSEMHILPGA